MGYGVWVVRPKGAPLLWGWFRKGTKGKTHLVGVLLSWKTRGADVRALAGRCRILNKTVRLTQSN